MSEVQVDIVCVVPPGPHQVAEGVTHDGYEFWCYQFDGDDEPRFLVCEVGSVNPDASNGQHVWSLVAPPWYVGRGAVVIQEGQEQQMIDGLLAAGAWWLTPEARAERGYVS